MTNSVHANVEASKSIKSNSNTSTTSAIDPQVQVNNLNIVNEKILLTPENLKDRFPLSIESARFVAESRLSISNILAKKDHRQLAIVGPCSIHDIGAAKEYALKLKALSEKVSDELFVVMRVYFEKPRTTVGWKGLINDPHINNSFEVEEGLSIARELLIWLADQQIPVATEVLDPISPQYLSELISWAAIGARTSESQTHREMASGLSMPIGYKNGTDGSASAAINAMKAAASGHSFMGINQQGQVTLLETRGNKDGHVILRGGKNPNYKAEDVALYEQRLSNAGLPSNIMIDCSHGNSNKDHRLQPKVLENVIQQVVEGNDSIIGFMLESHLNEGNQKALNGKEGLKYGVSITDACIDWQTTENCLLDAADRLRDGDATLSQLRDGITF
ncbi:3-deoxy-7-phosphoheptulonate synthase [Aliikangiella sp. G2MR2-5]|uniref:3-deoxy-7-phosphoheptulonate synthase n=1 Tax=Aliikangiella sp. G2MR2-5 TaxID=2788943 RepID=UPI0018A93DE3|nr:3-deoxy-7-phosphoheptulonate synthase [Aliikangiella sp. G2MR2-5]